MPCWCTAVSDIAEYHIVSSGLSIYMTPQVICVPYDRLSQ